MINTELIKDFICKNKLTKREFCKICKISYEVFAKIMNKQRNFRIIALFKIAKIMSVQICDLFEKIKPLPEWKWLFILSFRV